MPEGHRDCTTRLGRRSTIDDKKRLMEGYAETILRKMD